MKTYRLLLTLALVLLAAGITGVQAQEQPADALRIVSGTVKDSRTNRPIEGVTIMAGGTDIGTVTNADGQFALKFDDDLDVAEIRLSCIGYYNARFAIGAATPAEQVYRLKPEAIQLNELQVVGWRDPRELVRAALDKVAVNYAETPSMLTGFYRETIRKRRRYINISEAVVSIYKEGYGDAPDRDCVKILKGRKLVSPKKADTLSVMFLGGPAMPVYMDVVKNPDMLLSTDMLEHYRYRMGDRISIDDRLQYTVHFEPMSSLPYPLYIGTFYIDCETLSFTRAEFSMDMRDRLKVIDAILREKPRGLRFTPEEVKYLVTYRRQPDGRTGLSYVRNEVRFKCDWKRRLFATSYTVQGETVITDRTDRNVVRIPSRETFKLYQSLSREVSLYEDDDFWGSYNIIEPTESLENAVGRLRKQYDR